ncbi:MAG: hypothetical protein WC551_10565 [Patescibacteria group bacterium]
MFPKLCQAIGLSEPMPEYRFDSERRWRFDWCFPEVRLAVEIEGGIFTQGRHTRGSGYIKDLEKYNRATALGWHILRYPPNMIDYKQINATYRAIVRGF